MVIVDTSVLIDYLADRITLQTHWMGLNISSQRIGITSLIQTEVLQGIREDKLFAEALVILNGFEIFETGSSELAIASARNFRVLRKTGITIRSTIDSLIATFCIEEGHILLHNDRDFDVFETRLGLQVLHPPRLLPH